MSKITPKGEPKLPRRAVVYTRVSTGQQTENTSLAGQYAVCARKALDEGSRIVAHCEETASGGLYLTRGELQKALELIENGDADDLILAKLDRTGRELESLRDIRRRVERNGGHLIFADGMQFEQNAVGNLLFSQMGAFAEFERELIKERMIGGLERVAASGKQPSRAKSPYGYRVWIKDDVTRGQCTPDELGTYILVPEESRWIKPLFERVADGQSLRSCAAWLTESGATPRLVAIWNPVTLRGMIRNVVYKGAPQWRKTKSTVDESRAEKGIGIRVESPRPESERVDLAPCPALVSKALWARANETLERGRAERSGRNDHRYLLTGLLWCTKCGRRVLSMSSSSRRKGGRVDYHLYGCSGCYRRQSHQPKTCDLPKFAGAALDALVIELIIELFQTPEIVAAAQKSYKDSQTQTRASEPKVNVTQIKREIEACRKREAIAAQKEVDAVMNGSDGSAFERVRADAAFKRHALEAELEKLNVSQKPAKAKLAIPLSGAHLIENVLREQSISDVEKNALLRRLISGAYPVALAPELQVNARAVREGRASTKKNGMLGGIELVLQTEADGPCYVLSRKLVAWEAYQDSSGREAQRAMWETTLRIETVNPFPEKIGRASSAELAQWREK